MLVSLLRLEPKVAEQMGYLQIRHSMMQAQGQGIQEIEKAVEQLQVWKTISVLDGKK